MTNDIERVARCAGWHLCSLNGHIAHVDEWYALPITPLAYEKELTNDGLRVLEDRLLKAGWHHYLAIDYNWLHPRTGRHEVSESREAAAIAAYLAAFEEAAR